MFSSNKTWLIASEKDRQHRKNQKSIGQHSYKCLSYIQFIIHFIIMRQSYQNKSVTSPQTEKSQLQEMIDLSEKYWKQEKYEQSLNLLRRSACTLEVSLRSIASDTQRKAGYQKLLILTILLEKRENHFREKAVSSTKYHKPPLKIQTSQKKVQLIDLLKKSEKLWEDGCLAQSLFLLRKGINLLNMVIINEEKAESKEAYFTKKNQLVDRLSQREKSFIDSL